MTVLPIVYTQSACMHRACDTFAALCNVILVAPVANVVPHWLHHTCMVSPLKPPWVECRCSSSCQSILTLPISRGLLVGCMALCLDGHATFGNPHCCYVPMLHIAGTCAWSCWRVLLPSIPASSSWRSNGCRQRRSAGRSCRWGWGILMGRWAVAWRSQVVYRENT